MANLPSAGLRARVALDKHGFRAAHSLGQNFLLDDSLLNGLLDAAGIGSGDRVLEIGPGAGVMTALMAQRGAKVLAVEIDEKLRPVLADVLAPCEGARVVFADFLKTDAEALTREVFGDAPFCVVANLPYYITAEILTKLATGSRKPDAISIMVQKEAADRIMSEPGDKQWCALAAILRSYGTARVVETVPPEAFEPVPHVVSCFIRVERYAEKPYGDCDDDALVRTIRCAFAMRRKTLANNLKASFGISQETAAEVFKRAALPDKVRGEALTMSELARLSGVLKELGCL